jgi:hypothetical protein
MYCALNDGNAHFVDFHIQSPTPSDGAGWTVASEYSTLRFSALTGSSGQKLLCGRGSSGILCEAP